jgi:hypothetical protein
MSCPFHGKYSVRFVESDAIRPHKPDPLRAGEPEDEISRSLRWLDAGATSGLAGYPSAALAGRKLTGLCSSTRAVLRTGTWRIPHQVQGRACRLAQLHTSMFFCEQERTTASFHGIGQSISRYGLFASPYTDRGSDYFLTPEAGSKVDKLHLTEVGRALKQLGIEHIAAYSPEARGRSERAIQMRQGRLPQELARGGARLARRAGPDARSARTG